MHFGWFRPEAKVLMTNKIDRKYAGRKCSANLHAGTRLLDSGSELRSAMRAWRRSRVAGSFLIFIVASVAAAYFFLDPFHTRDLQKVEHGINLQVQESMSSGNWSDSLEVPSRTDTLSIDDSAAQKLQAKSRLLCWVPSTESRLSDKVKAVNETWLQRCDGRVIFVNTKQPNPDVIRLDVPEGRQHLTAKSVAALVYLYKHYLHDYDWFLKADDDAYIIVENLRFLLSHYNHSAPVYLGHLYKGYHKAGYMSGGASYVISREALRLANEDGYQKNKCKTTGTFEDVDVGICLHTVGVDSHNSVDIFGRETFHPLQPHVHIVGPIPKDQIPQDRLLMVAGHNCCSELTISFHHMDSNLIRIFDHLLYRVTVYGRLPDLGRLGGLFEPKAIPPLP